MNRKILRTNGKRFCEIEIRLENGRLSVCGTEGRIERRAAAKKEALEYWRTFFEDQPEEIYAMNKRCGTRFTSPTGAAKYVLEQDGDLHGLDVRSGGFDGRDVMIIESCGQIPETIREFFPELAPLLAWHLNDMHAECEHQEARGETWTSHPSAKCPDCGYVLGSAWLKRELPPEIVRLAETGAAEAIG